MKSTARFCAVAVLTVLLASVVSAQEFTGNINGRVMDDTGAVIPGVSVTLTSPAMQGSRNMITDEAGNYRFILLPPGTYKLQIELAGFKTLVRDGVVVEVGRTTTINATLEVATLAETVTVTGESPVVDVQNATVGVNFNQGLLRDLPNARDLWVVLAQTPGIQTTRFDVGGSTMGTQTGYRSYGVPAQNWVNLDGVVTTEGTSGAGFYMDYGAFAEIQVSAAANAAEVPVPGAFINTVVKTGGNGLKGEVYFDWEDDKFQSQNVTDDLRDRGIGKGDQFTRYNDFNVNVGGPFVKDKFWWFGSLRDQFSGLATELKQNDGSAGGVFTTRLQNQTVKFNYQLNPNNSIIFTGQAGRKFQPVRGGSGTSASFFIVDSTGSQDSWSWVQKYQWTSVISSRATLDVSANNFGYHFPINQRVAETPRRDIGTSLVRGGYSGTGTGLTTATPFRQQRRRWHTNANLSYFVGEHDLKFGYGWIYEDIRYTAKGVPGSAGTPGHIVLYTNNGAPDRFQVQNTPFKYQDALAQNFFFIQDKWQLGRRVTLNLGFRFDRYANYSPEQGNPGTGPFAAKTAYAKATFPVFNNPVPRVALNWDVFGNTKTALKMAWGRYSENTAHNVASLANPNSTIITRRYRWDGRPASQLTSAYVASLEAQGLRLEQIGQATQLAVDPNLKNAHTDELTAGISHEIVTDFAFNVNFVRKINKDNWERINRAQPLSGWAPRVLADLGRDGVLNTSDDKPFTVFDRLVAANVDSFLTNFGGGNNYTTFEFGATKRMSNNWQMITGFDWTKRNLQHNLQNSNDPNILLYGSDAGEHTKNWTYKLIGSYILPKGVAVHGTYNAQKGEAYGRRQNFALRQGTTAVFVEPEGSYYYPTVHLTNLRVEKKFQVTDRNAITAMFDLFNIANANTVTGVDTLTGTTRDRNGRTVQRFNRVTQILNPRIFRLALRWNF